MDAPFVPRIEGDRLYGRGAYDMKAGLAAALIACRDAAELDLAGDVVVAAVADEEHASIGVQEILGAVRADAAIVTEPTEMALVVAHRGFVWSEVEVTGRAAHGSRPHLGVDAIVKAGPVLTALGRLDETSTSVGTRSSGRPSVHASVITGGEELSSYPGQCVVGIERRTLPGESVADVEAELEHLLDACRAEDEALVESRGRCSCASRSRSRRMPRRGARRGRSRRHARRRPAIEGASYWADAAFIAAAGIPTVMYGPSGEGAHALEEWVGLSDTEAVARVLVDVARRDLRMRALVNGSATRGGRRARRRRSCVPRVASGIPAHACPRADIDRDRARARSRGREGRVRPARASGLQGARRVVGRRAAPRSPARRSTRSSPRAPGTTGARSPASPRCGAFTAVCFSPRAPPSLVAPQLQAREPRS